MSASNHSTLGCRCAEPLAGVLEGAPGDVEHRRFAVARGQQPVDQHRGAAADVDHRGLFVDAAGLNQLQRQARLGLVPAHVER
ncbi:MAG: hypothetical protein MZV65_52390 [Chromatiales bacterium]|nr:hypothetical protein [Chromatiales bacterium]